jgi:hypothetical protein
VGPRDPAGAADEAVDFALTLEGVKVFRARDQPDFVVLSNSDITPRTAVTKPSADLEDGSLQKSNYFKALGEQALRNSGLAYCIVRISGFSGSPTEGRPLSVSKVGRGGVDTRGARQSNVADRWLAWWRV